MSIPRLLKLGHRSTRGLLSTIVLCAGCHSQPPGRMPIQPVTLGTVVDEANRLQEENAEMAKLIVYTHEFEINLQHEPPKTLSDDNKDTGFRYEPTVQIRGIRLTPDGQDHVRRIARMLQSGTCPPGSLVLVERSRTSKHWDTKHHYPVHFNDELDAIRRDVIVNILTTHGIPNAESLVVVAPAFPTGLDAQEAANAFEYSIYRSNQFSGRRR